MKKLSFLSLFLAISVIAAGPTANIEFSWTPPIGVNTSEIDAFTLHYSYNPTLPLTNWIVLSSFQASTNGSWVTNKTIAMPSAASCFFVISSSNGFWGDSIAYSNVSNVAYTPAFPNNSQGLGIKKK